MTNDRGKFGQRPPGQNSGQFQSKPGNDYQYFVANELDALARTPPASANLSLILDKYVGSNMKEPPDPGKQWLKDKFIGIYQSADRNITQKGFSSYRERWKVFLKAQGAATQEMSTAWRLAIHLGRSSVVENGSILLHPTLGFPYLPGQSLKGLARAYATQELQLPEAELDELFGWQHGNTASEGVLVFYDAIPVVWPDLKVDILNPHFGEWYSSNGARDKKPSDNGKLTPVYFLTVAPDSPFLFGVGTVARCRNEPQAPQWANRGLQLLTEALHELGAGAKTAAGYGQFK
jgi:CRISPR type III-B/RAMP module RAMP protein Cmr6